MKLLARLQKHLSARQPLARADCIDIPILNPDDGPVYCVGDTHGCLSLYQEMEAHILRDARHHDGVATVVLLGDMVDRGPQSAALIDHLLRPPPPPLRRVCLRGNHEAMMLDFLAAPLTHAGWLHLGGSETLASYGIDTDPKTLRRLPERKLHQTLAAHIPDTHVAFLRQTLPGLHLGDYLLAHAGADADAPLTAQPWQALLWGHAGQVAPNGLTLVHGHFITENPVSDHSSIGIDTGAYATGRLTALRLLPGQAPACLTTKQGATFRMLSEL